MCILAFSSGVGRRFGPTSNGGASRLNGVSLVFCSPVFTFGRCETPQVDENEGRLVDTFGTSAAKEPFPLEKIEGNPYCNGYLNVCITDALKSLQWRQKP